MSKPPVRSAHECEIDMEYPLASHKTLPSRDVEPAQHPALWVGLLEAMPAAS